MKERVAVWGELVEIDVDHISKTVWIARGEYKGKNYEVKRKTRGAAAKAWAEAARYHSN